MTHWLLHHLLYQEQEQFLACIHILLNLKIKLLPIYPNPPRVQEIKEERNLVKEKLYLNNNTNNHFPNPLSKKNSVKKSITTIIMRITEVIVGDANPTEVNKVVEDHIKAHNTGDGDNKTITEANIKVTMGNFTTLMETIITPIIW